MKLHPVQAHHLDITRYLAPASKSEALEMLADSGGRARLIAGGTDLLLEMGRGQRPEVDTLIDLSRVPGLADVSATDRGLMIGATATHGHIVQSPLVVERALPLAQACLEIGSPQLRNRATVVGNVATASPANDTISALRALGTTIVIESTRGTREVDLADFHTGLRATVLEPDEMVTSLIVSPLSAAERGVFVKLGLRRAQAISVIHMTVVLGFDGAAVTRAAITLGSVAPTIINASAAEAFLVGKQLDEAAIAEAARLIAGAATPIDDIRATASYRSEQLRVLGRRSLSTLAEGTHRRHWPASVISLADRADGANPTRTGDGRSIEGTSAVSATVNGVRVEAAAGTGSMLDWLRDQVGLTGSKEGCAEGECGACTVFLDGMAVMSCLVPAGRADGSEVVTIEGLAGDGSLHRLQQAFIEHGAVQCGFCIPGFIMSGAKLLEEREQPTAEEVRAALAGNLCRCTGYYKIVRAIEAAAGVATP